MNRMRSMLHVAGVAVVAAFGTGGFVGARLVARPDTVAAPAVPSPAPRFEPWDLFIDPGGATLAAWQVSVECQDGASVALVGVEGGEPAVFHEPPAYDPKALADHRLVLAAYSLADAALLPTEPFRATTLHLEISGAPTVLHVHIDAAAGPDGRPVHPRVRLQRRGTP